MGVLKGPEGKRAVDCPQEEGIRSRKMIMGEYEEVGEQSRDFFLVVSEGVYEANGSWKKLRREGGKILCRNWVRTYIGGKPVAKSYDEEHWERGEEATTSL